MSNHDGSNLPPGPVSRTLPEITEQRKSATALLLLRALVDRSNDSIEVVDPETARFLDVNETAGIALGYSREEHLELSVFDIDPMFPAEDHGKWRDQVEQIRHAGSLVFETQHIRRDGSVFPVEISAAFVNLERDYIVAVVRDISDRKRAEIQIRKLNRLYAVLSEINKTIVREKDAQAMFRSVCRIAVETGGFRMAWIGILNEKTRVVKPVASAGVVDGYLDSVNIDLNDPLRNAGPSGRAILTGEHQVCNDMATDPNLRPWREAALERGYMASTSFPLKVGGKFVGVYTLYASETEFFDAAELRLLDGLAMDIGFALEVFQRQSDHLAAKERHSRQRDALISLTGSVEMHEGDFTAAMCRISEVIAQTMRLGRVDIWRFNEDHSVIRCLNQFDADLQRHDSGQQMPLTDCPVYLRSISESAVLTVKDALADPRTSELKEVYLIPNGVGALMDATIFGGGSIIGILCLNHMGSTRDWTTDEKAFAMAMANLVSLCIESRERKQAETALRASEERFRELAETIADVFWVSDPHHGALLYISPAYEKIWGRSCQSLYDNPLAWLEAIHPDDREIVRRAMTQRGAGSYDEEYRIIRADGAQRWIRDTAFPVHSQAHGVERIVGVARDITERRELEQQLILSQKLEGIGQLAGGVAHDFNNILAAILMQVEISQAEEGLSNNALEGLLQIRQAAKRAANLTRQLLLFSSKQVMQQSDLDLNEIITSLTMMLRRILGEDIYLRLNLHATPLITRADAGMLDQILMNLVVNARDAMPDGGQLSIQTTLKTVDAKFASLHPGASPGRYVCLSLEDTGSGITPEVLPRIFEPFFTTKGPGRGTGLGLATIFGIVKQHRGWIQVESSVGEGTVFQIFLPASTATHLDPSTAPASLRSPSGVETVLVVEDDPSVRLLTRTLLEQKGYTVLEAAGGVEALKLWPEHGHRIQLVLTDLVMPGGIRGLDLGRELRARRHDLKIIFTSGYSVDFAGQALELQKGETFLQKPCPPEQLLKTVRSCLDA